MDKKLMLEKMLIGHYVESVPDQCKKKVCYVMQRDGIWEVRSNKLGAFTTHVAECDIPGLTSDMEEGWELTVPQIPADFLVKIITFFRKINTIHDSEVFLQIFYNLEKNEYFIWCPKQRVSGASVHYENDDHMQDPNNLLVLEIHSHNTMSAFFSATDDADEKGDRFFGVVGKINNFFPEIKLRLSVGSRKRSVDIDELFDVEEDVYHSDNFPKEWLDHVKKSSPNMHVKKFRGGRYQYTFPNQHAFPNQYHLALFDNDDDDFIDFMESTDKELADRQKSDAIGQEILDSLNEQEVPYNPNEEDEEEKDYKRNWRKWRF